jgi:hypothetical protein
MKSSNLNHTNKSRKPANKKAGSGIIGWRNVFSLGLALSLLLLAAGRPGPVSAQPTPTLRFSPHPAVIDTHVGKTTVVEVVVENAEDINAFDIQIDYDPTVALISGWEQGSFLPGVICLVPLEEPGSLKLACTKTGPGGSSGSGSLVKLTFQATPQGGTTALNLSNAELVHAVTNDLVPVQVVPGELQVISYRLALPLVLKEGAGPSALPANNNLALNKDAAQQSVNLWFDPNPSQVKMGEVTTVKLMVDAQNAVGGFDLVFEYDPNIVLLENWKYGGFLTKLSAIKNEVSPGHLWLVSVQLGVPSVSGTGVLLEFNLRGLAAGVSALALPSAKFADALGNQYNAGLPSGSISVQAGVLPTLTSTPTPTLTMLPSQSPVPSATLTLVPTPTPKATNQPPTATRTSTPSLQPTSTLKGGLSGSTATPITTRSANLAGVSQSAVTGQSEQLQTAYPGNLAAQSGSAATKTCEANYAAATLSAMSTAQSVQLTSTPVQASMGMTPTPEPDEKGSQLDLTTGIIVFDLFTLAFIIFLLWRRRRKKVEGKL